MLKRHISVVHDGVKYKCDQCAYTVTSSKSLKRHMSDNVHNAQACSQCNEMFDNPERLVRHVFVCSIFLNPFSSLGETFVEAHREETFPL